MFVTCMGFGPLESSKGLLIAAAFIAAFVTFAAAFAASRFFLSSSSLSLKQQFFSFILLQHIKMNFQKHFRPQNVS